MVLVTSVGLGLGLAQAAAAQPERPYAVTEERTDCRAYAPERRPFFGDTHVHTAYSFDASAQDTRNTPRDAYRFAKGESMGIQPYTEEGEPTRTIQLDRPLDFAVVTDHAELLGEVHQCMTRDSGNYWAPFCIVHRNFPTLAFQIGAARTLVTKTRWGFCGDEGEVCLGAARGVWGEIQDAAEESYDRSKACRFTSFVGYEYTATVGDGQNLHRNVIFRNAKVPEMPVSWVDTPSALDLWDQLEAKCVQGIEGCDVLTIPHNSNLSGGLMFQSAGVETAEDADMAIGPEEARRRSRWEPLVEVMQHKGDSECDVAAGFADEACDFENLPYDRFGAKFSAFVDRATPSPSNFMRQGLKEGLRIDKEQGANPFKFGVVASTDTHIAAPGLVAEEGHPGHGGAGQGAGEDVPLGFPDDFEFSPGGLAVLYAEENTRDSLFAAMQRREAYGTSGTRPEVRFFGGWGYDADLCSDRQFAKKGYAGGVPMGSDLPERPAEAGAPRFAVSALKDSGTRTNPGTPLQRVQIIKGWLEGDELKEEVLDVAGGPNDADVDLATCERNGAGAKQLCTVWEDPSFDPEAPAFYYARVLENPTCRWSQYVCNAAKVDCSDPTTVPEELAACCSEAHRPKQQERAWTSPIWYTPGQSRPDLTQRQERP
jgi:hypothetical protein